MNQKIGIIDYGMGNILSVSNAFEMLGADIEICDQAEQLLGVDKIVLPGVGAFRDCIERLNSQGFAEVLNEQVLRKGRPILGICLGMQVMAKKSYEMGEYDGLGWFDAEVKKLEPKDKALRVPHVGWNDIDVKKPHDILDGIPTKADFYFVHSYWMNCNNREDVLAVCEYEDDVTAAVQKDNIIALQFHPEKSQDYGMKILENFMRWEP